MAQGIEQQTAPEVRTNLFLFGFPGSNVEAIGSHVLTIINDYQPYSEPYTLTNVSNQDLEYPYPAQMQLHVARVMELAKSDEPQIVIASPDVLAGDCPLLAENPDEHAVATRKVRDAISHEHEGGRFKGLAVLLNVDPGACATRLSGKDLPFILRDQNGDRARDANKAALKLAHEAVRYSLSTAPEVVAEVIADVALQVPTDYTSVAKKSIFIDSNWY